MLTKLKKLEDIKTGLANNDNYGHYEEDILDIALFMQYSIDILNNIIDRQEQLFKKVRDLKQKDSYYPNVEEIRTLKVGGTD